MKKISIRRYFCLIRSNHFAVEDQDRFREFCEKYHLIPHFSGDSVRFTGKSQQGVVLDNVRDSIGHKEPAFEHDLMRLLTDNTVVVVYAIYGNDMHRTDGLGYISHDITAYTRTGLFYKKNRNKEFDDISSFLTQQFPDPLIRPKLNRF